ncbi:MAG: hypothetical protein ACK4UN_16075, partial [Limisphaerales bacterium]
MYGSNPTLYDTDKDKVPDGKEIEIGTDPTKFDTDGDGSSDFEVTVVEQVPIIEEDLALFEGVGVIPSVEVAGRPNAGLLTTLSDAYQYDVMMPKIAGLVGHPIDLTTTSSFDKATIRFKVSERLQDVDLNNLRVMWWDDQNQQMVVLPNQRIDHEQRTVSAETTHFSKYVLIDISKWFRVWEEGYDPGKPTVLRGRIEGFAVATAYPYRNGAVLNYGVVDRATVESALQSSGAHMNLVRNQEFSYEANSENFVSEAIDRLASDPSLQDKWKILVVASDKRRFNDSNLEAALQKAEDHQIKLFTVWTSNEQGSGSWELQTIAKRTRGSYYVDSLKNISESTDLLGDMWMEIIKEEDADSDGIPDRVEKRGIILGTGERLLPSTSTEDLNFDGKPDGQDTDGDGGIDGYELGYTDRAGKAFNMAKQKKVVSLSHLALTSRPSIAPRDEADCSCYGSSAKVVSSPNTSDTDWDDLGDYSDAQPLDYFKRPIFMLHGLTSNAMNVFGAPNAIAPEGGFWQNNLLNNEIANLNRDYLVNIQNQAVLGEGLKFDGIYYYLKEYVKDSKNRPLFVHGDNMFVFNYANIATFDFNGALFRDYVSLLKENGKLKGPTVEGNDPRIDLIVHSMGGLVARYYNEKLDHPLDISTLITIATPHRGGNWATIATFTSQITDMLAAALSSLSELDYDLAKMNYDLVNDPKKKGGARYYAM